jgi:uncharacterized membrane protein
LTPDCNTMIKHLFLLALILIVVDISAAAAVASGVNIATPSAQNATSGNTTGKNLTTSEERGAYSEYGG